MTDDKKGHDAADWLASQFGSPDPDEGADAAAESRAAAAGTPDTAAHDGADTAADADGRNRAGDGQRAGGFGSPAPAASPGPDAAPASPAAPASSGFSWGLTPTNAAPPVPPSESPAAAEEGAEPAPVTTPEPARPEPLPPATSVFAPPPAVVPPAVTPTPLMPPPELVAPAEAVEPPELVEPPEPQRLEPQPQEPQPLDGSLAGAPSLDAEPPTMALPWESAGTELFTPAAARGPVAEPATELLSGFETSSADAAAESSVDALFGESRFRDYDAEPGTSQNPFVRGAEPAAAPGRTGGAARAPRTPMPRQQKVLLSIAGGLAALLVLVGLFFLGTKLPHAEAAAPVLKPTVKPSPTQSPTPTTAPVGPVAPGSYKWDRLLGGECLTPFDSPWAEKFTVVDCATPHPAQMVARGTFVEPTAAVTDPSAPATPAAGEAQAGSSYPGVDALQAQINLLCSAPTVINFAAAGAYSDIQFTASYPANDKQWSDGDHDYYCFVTRSSGEPLTASVAVPPAA